MTLISERVAIMPKVSMLAGLSFQYPSQVFSPPFMADKSLTLPAAESTWVPQADRVIVGNKERGATGSSPLSITSCSSNISSRLASIDLMLDEESREKLKIKMKQLESKLKKEREFHRAILDNYEDETVWDMEETRYGMHLYWYKWKIQQCKIVLVHTGSIKTLKAVAPSLARSVESVAIPTQHSGQVPSQGTG